MESDDLVKGRYRLKTLLGEGGMGEVWRAWDEVLHRDVAVKRLRMPPDLGREEAARRMARMEREARAAGALRHGGIVTVHDRFTDDKGAFWIVMEFVSGRSLAEVIGDDGRLSPERTARIGARIAEALVVAHEVGVVHRDIKPANILLDEEQRVVLTDFGIAVFEGATTLTAAGGLMGTPAYMSPEQVNGERGTPASDLWSLGVTLYQAVEGRHAFAGANLAVTLLAIDRGDPAPMVHAGPLEPVLRSLMSRDPAHRPTAAEAAARLSAPDRSFPSTVTNPSFPPAPRSPAPTRRRLLLAMGAVGTAVAVPAAYQVFDRETPSRRTNTSPTPSKTSTPPPPWNTPRQDGEALTTFGDISSVAFSPDGRTLAIATSTSEEGRVQLWDVETRTKQGEFLRSAEGQDDPGDQILRVVFSPSGRLLATASLVGTVRLWDAATRAESGRPLEHNGTVKDVVFSPDGRLLATVGLEKPVRLWDVATRRVVRTLDPKFRLTPINAVAFDPKGGLLAAGSEGEVRLWDLGTGKSSLLRAQGMTGQLAFSPDGRLLAAGGSGRGQIMVVWDVATRTRLKRRFEGSNDEDFLTSVAFSPDGGTLAAASINEVVWLWDVATGKWAADPLAHSGMVETVAFSPDGRLLATGTKYGDGAVHLWRP